MMKKYFSIIVLIQALIVLVNSSTVYGQAPQRISYQEVIRNPDGILVTDRAISMRITIFRGTKGPTSDYCETHSVTTDGSGVARIEIGAGTVVSGSMENINWSAGNYSVTTETDPEGGTSYTLTQTSQLLSVPYALHAKSAGTLSEPLAETDPLFTSWDKDYDDLSNKPDLGKYSVGDYAHGGIVIWVDETGRHGLVCAKNDCATKMRWYAGTSGLTWSRNLYIYDGRVNTMIIIAAHVAIGDDGAIYAARACNELVVTDGGKSYGDWYLPSKEELFCMILYRPVIDASLVANGGSALVQTPGSFYWSSAEANTDNAYGFIYGELSARSILKTNEGYVRPVRAF